MLILIFLASLAALVWGGLVIFAARLADEPADYAPIYALVLVCAGGLGVAVTMLMLVVRLAHWVFS